MSLVLMSIVIWGSIISEELSPFFKSGDNSPQSEPHAALHNFFKISANCSTSSMLLSAICLNVWTSYSLSDAASKVCILEDLAES